MGNVLDASKQQQVVALGRLGWSLRRIEQATGVRRETISGYLRVAGERGIGPTNLDEIRVLEVRDGGLMERGNLDGLIADPPFKVTLSATLTYQTYEPIEYNTPQVEQAHAEMGES